MFETIDKIDKIIFEFINGQLYSEWLDILMTLASNKFAWIPLYLLFIALIYKKYAKKWWIVLAGLLICVGLSDSISSKVLKPLVQRPRPCTVQELHARTPDGCSTSFGFVSSHAANHAAIAVFVILLLGLKKSAKFALMVWVALIMYSRVYLGKHYVGDVLAGAALGLVIALLMVNFVKMVLRKLG